jgi:sterol 24-C-methyltransferase
MYIPPVMDLNANITMNQNLYEESVAEELNLPPKPRLLDLGCGRGRVAAHMTRLTGARVTGINIDDDQVASAKAYNAKMKFENNFIRMDFNDLPLPLPDNEFDGFYNVQAFSLCKDLPKLCAELYRVLKPGARLSLLDWAKLDAFNDEDTHHQDLLRRIKPLIGAVGTPTPETMAADIESAGFKIVKHNNASIDGLQSPLIERAEWFFRIALNGVLGLVRVGMLPGHFKTLMLRFRKDGNAFIEADKARLITTSYHWLAEKPRNLPPLASPQVAAANTDATALVNSSSNVSSAASSEKGARSSATSSERGTKSSSPANSDSSAFSAPPLAPDEPKKHEAPSVNDTVTVSA